MAIFRGKCQGKMRVQMVVWVRYCSVSSKVAPEWPVFLSRKRVKNQ